MANNHIEESAPKAPLMTDPSVMFPFACSLFLVSFSLVATFCLGKGVLFLNL